MTQPIPIPITDHKVFEEMFNALTLVIQNMPPCTCHRAYKDRDMLDPNCHRHAFFFNDEIQTIYFAHDHARRLKEKAAE
ncbi:MAG: hypothetical protein R3293_28080 [Candidatus Promineifilaceae bacterium]|nr:hypothetical protein [Candidatus Promineifilaceae bacterium]